MQKIVKPEHPCRQDCEFRNSRCHATCQDYKKFEKLNDIYRKYMYEQKYREYITDDGFGRKRKRHY